MDVPRYTPGEWLVAVADGAVALVPPTTTDALIGRLWESLRGADGAGVVDHLQVLVRDGLATLPPFALLTLRGALLHVVVRGAVEVEVVAAGRSFVLTAPGVATWSDEVVEGVEGVTVRAPGAGGAAVDGLPLVAGVAAAAAVHLRPAVCPAASADAVDLAGDVPARPAEAVLADAVPVEDVPAEAPTPDVVPVDVVAGDAVPSAVLPADAGDVEPLDITLLRPVAAPVSAATSLATSPDLGGEDAAEAAPAAPVSAAPVSAAPAPAEPVPAAPVLAPAVPTPRAAQPAPGFAPEPGARRGSTDHDGTTVLSADVVELRRQLPEWAGHVAAPVAPVAASPAPARLALSTGERVTLTRPVLLGRAPQAARVHSSQVPQLVTVPSPLQDISRTHAEVRMDGDDVVLTDLRSTNGVLVVRPAAAPQRLQPGEATVLQPGVLVDLGEGVTFTVERSA